MPLFTCPLLPHLRTPGLTPSSDIGRLIRPFSLCLPYILPFSSSLFLSPSAFSLLSPRPRMEALHPRVFVAPFAFISFSLLPRRRVVQRSARGARSIFGGPLMQLGRVPFGGVSSADKSTRTLPRVSFGLIMAIPDNFRTRAVSGGL